MTITVNHPECNVKHKCENCGADARWRIRDVRPYNDYLYYCDKCKEEMTIPESKPR